MASIKAQIDTAIYYIDILIWITKGFWKWLAIVISRKSDWICARICTFRHSKNLSNNIKQSKTPSQKQKKAWEFAKNLKWNPYSTAKGLFSKKNYKRPLERLRTVWKRGLCLSVKLCACICTLKKQLVKWHQTKFKKAGKIAKKTPK